MQNMIHAYFHRTSFYIALICLLIIVHNVHGEIDHSVDASVIAASGYSSKKVRDRDDATDHWYISGLGGFSYTLTGKEKNIKGQMRISINGAAQNGLLLELSRAYLRTQVPFTPNYAMQLELGKNTIAWGEGSYYNAGDIIFDINPKSSSLYATEFRDYAIWNLRLFFPITPLAYIEPIIAIPEQRFIFLNSNDAVATPLVNIDETGSGLRAHFETGPLQWGLGGYSRFVSQQFDYFLSLAIPTTVRIYFAASSAIDYSENAKDITTQYEQESAASGGLLYSTGLANGGTISLQTELLYQNYLALLQANVSWYFNRVLGIIVRWNMNIQESSYLLLLGPQWQPHSGFIMSLFSNTSIARESENVEITTGAVLSMQYKY